MRWLPSLLLGAASVGACWAQDTAATTQADVETEPDVYTLLHRVSVPGQSPGTWAPRAQIKLSADPATQLAAGQEADPDQASALYRRIAGKEEWDALTKDQPRDALYQVALVPAAAGAQAEDVTNQEGVALSSTKLCTLTGSAPHEATIVATPASESAPLTPLAVEFAAQVERTQLDSAGCVKDTLTYPIEEGSGLTVRVRHPFQARLPALRFNQVEENNDPNKKPEPEPEPEAEKGFLQKYWMYILPAVVLLLTSNKPPEEGQGGGDAQ